MATKTAKKSKPPKRKKRLESPTEVIADFVAGMKGDKEVPGPVRVLGDAAYRKRIRGVISTHAATLDAAIGRGGYPLSRIVIFHGREGCGKTTLALHACAAAQKAGGIGVYFDKEHKMDPDYAEQLGVDVKNLVMPKTKTLESAIGYIKATIRRAREIRKKVSKVVPIVMVLDSLNAFKAFETLETDTGKKRYPAEARIWSEELPDICDEIAEENVLLILISQVRKKMNVMFGSDEELAAGNAPRFYASLILYITRIGTEKEGDKVKVGSLIETECKKNQVSPPFKKARFTIYWNRGIDYEHSLLLQLAEMGLVEKVKKKGVTIGSFALGETYVQAAKRLRAMPELREKLIALFYKRMKWDRAEVLT